MTVDNLKDKLNGIPAHYTVYRIVGRENPFLQVRDESPNTIKILREAEEFRSAEGVEGLVKQALAESGASVETEREVS